MLTYSYAANLDEIDIVILQELQRNGRISNVELAQKINLSPPATHTRVKRLAEQGYIREFVALLDQEKVGYEMTCFIRINLELHQIESLKNFRAVVMEMPEVLECYHVTGEFDYLLKVIVRTRKELEQFIVNRLTPIAGVAHIYTSLVLSTIKTTTALPLQPIGG
ncbi:MAG: Lrp/AsnC family transcriptional regulator [Anaerolineales bacterium]|nr:Lrp/AsnC family transcriptional regulator [Anaerolineales bacterium]MCA9930238.1 Lrp/AsnC family transcriptional regulator [Anaerolineales bacterium]